MTLLSGFAFWGSSLCLIEAFQNKAILLHECGQKHLSQGNKEKAKVLLQAAAQKGYADSQYLLGMIYVSEQNFTNAQLFFTAAANKKHPRASFMLGAMYRKGIGVKQDFIKAQTYLNQAIQQNVAEAMISLGLMYFIGSGLPKDYETAKGYFERAANQNNLNAQLILSNIYICEKKYEHARQLLKKAALHCPQNELKTITDLERCLEISEKSKEDFSKVFPKLLELSDKNSKDIW